MKFQPKRFVVEVKRGTNRAAFASPDPAPDRFSSAEALLFGEAPKPASKPKQAAIARAEVPKGRVLPSLVEPTLPVVEDLPPPVRRGRKPGSKNKPKIRLASSEPDSIAERPRRGRKPGSKNKPKLTLTDAAPSVVDIEAMGQDTAPQLILDEASSSAPSGLADETRTRTGRSSSRLRERSTILRRYVLDLDPLPGQAGAFRSRRLARAGR